MKPGLFVALVMSVFVLVMAMSSARISAKNPHTEAWIKAFREGHMLPDLDNGLFSTAGACESCHGSDPNGIASVTIEGEDVNVVDAWRASMMANSARDPYWKAKMRQEMLNAPAHADETGHFCTTCHAPLGRHAHDFTGHPLYTFEVLLSDSVGLDGVSCVACHQQSDENLGKNHSGDLYFETERIAYGPFQSPLASPMVMLSGYNPVYSEHISDAGICAGCHTLITSTIDLEGEFTGESFVEQATYHEWLNSIYGEDELNITCQSCHMPNLGMKNPIILAAGYETPGRAPFSRHNFTGANAFMLELMRDHRDTLGISASEGDFNAAIHDTRVFLQTKSLDLEVALLDRDADTLRIRVVLENLVGHKFPSGYPARRVFMKTEVIDAVTGETIFVSGNWDSEGYLIDEDDTFEPHYDVIRNASEVQIYEMVMADVNGNPTTLLEQGAGYLKDNRLVPLGFSTQHAVYDTTQLAGAVLVDPNFNRTPDGLEGTGRDEVRYFIPTLGNANELLIQVGVWYQAVPPKWTEDLFDVDDPLVGHFAEMYGAANKTPELVREATISAATFVGVNANDALEAELKVSHRGEVSLRSNEAGELFVFGLSGRMLVRRAVPSGNSQFQFDLPTGVYLFALQAQNLRRVKRVFIQ